MGIKRKGHGLLGHRIAHAQARVSEDGGLRRIQRIVPMKCSVGLPPALDVVRSLGTRMHHLDIGIFQATAKGWVGGRRPPGKHVADGNIDSPREALVHIVETQDHCWVHASEKRKRMGWVCAFKFHPDPRSQTHVLMRRQLTK
ncbi:MAG: hypothetical protein D6690_12730 [Nitrospirae bacterium]|nr:MAG: hypothetical protein D6690_12730 [Nitrospirota bacterium]